MPEVAVSSPRQVGPASPGEVAVARESQPWPWEGRKDCQGGLQKWTTQGHPGHKGLVVQGPGGCNSTVVQGKHTSLSVVPTRKASSSMPCSSAHTIR